MGFNKNLSTNCKRSMANKASTLGFKSLKHWFKKNIEKKKKVQTLKNPISLPCQQP